MADPVSEAVALAPVRKIERKIFLVKKDFQLRHVFYTLSLPVIFANLGIAAVPVLLYYWPPDVIAIPRFDEFLSFYFRFVVSAMIIEILGFVIVFWTTLRTSNRIAGPIFNVERCMDRVASADFKVTARFRAEDEFPELAAAFNNMMAGIRRGQTETAKALAEIARISQDPAQGGPAEAARRLALLAGEIEKRCGATTENPPVPPPN